EDTGRRVDYAYDALYRLVSESVTDPLGGSATFAYAYDPAGNRLTLTSATGTLHYTYDANDRLLSAGPTTYSYDLNGNTASITSGSPTILSYDFDDRLVAAASSTVSATFVYDPNGIRVASTINGAVTTFLVDRVAGLSRVLEERGDAGHLRVRYEYGL